MPGLFLSLVLVSWSQLADQANRSRAEGRWLEAETLYRSALAEARAKDPDHPRIAEMLNNLGAQHQMLGRYNEAEGLLVQALQEWQKHPSLAEALERTKSNLAGIHRALGRHREAERLYLEVLGDAARRWGKDSEGYGTVLAELAELYRREGRLDEAQEAAERAARLSGRGGEILAPILRARGRVTEALALLEKVRAWQSGHLPPNSPRLATTLNTMAEIHCSRREFERAETLAGEAVTIWERAYGPEHPNLAVGLNNVAQAVRLQGRFEEAEPLFRRSLDILGKNPSVRVEYAKCLGNFGDFHHAQGKEAEATRHYLRAIEVMEAALGKGHPETALLITSLAEVRRSQMRYRESAELYRRSIPILEQNFGPLNPRVVETVRGYQTMMREAGRHVLFAK